MATEGRHEDLVHDAIQVETTQDDQLNVQDDEITLNTDSALSNNQQSNISGQYPSCTDISPRGA